MVRKKNRKPEIPPISWFYETGGISPSPRKDKNIPKIIAVDVGRPEEGQNNLRDILHENPEDEDLDTECEENKRSRHESAIGRFTKIFPKFYQNFLACRNAGFKPYSFIAELGDMAVQHPDFQPVFQENFMLDRDALIIRNKLRVTFAKAQFQIDNNRV